MGADWEPLDAGNDIELHPTAPNHIVLPATIVFVQVEGLGRLHSHRERTVLNTLATSKCSPALWEQAGFVTAVVGFFTLRR